MDSSQHRISTDNGLDMVDEVLKQLHAHGLRRTAALRCLIQEMAAHPQPASLSEWSRRPSLRERNPVTLYRMMIKLEQAGVVRRVNIGERAACFQLILPGPQPDYLVCTNCGDLQPVEAPPEVRTMEQHLAASSGWKAVRHELEFFGLCPDCAEAGHADHPSSTQGC
jgi:Fe2+ or Zn2+ uptake regulation protein